ncbi:MAG: hypothetical protein Q4B85_13165 [Lachnospiraceae bacterium]|nr:hypothetical protein [Lachnospiraceae bacterium]
MRKGFITKLLAIAISAALAGTGCFSHVSTVYADDNLEEMSLETGNQIDEQSQLFDQDERGESAEIENTQTEDQNTSTDQDSASDKDTETDTGDSSQPGEEASEDTVDQTVIQPDSVEYDETTEYETENEEEIQENPATAVPYYAPPNTEWDGKTMTRPESDETGTYLIGTGAELKRFQNEVTVNRKTSINANLIDNIDLGGHRWTPIGTYEYPYIGQFNGYKCTISDLYLDNQSDQYYKGLFGCIGAGSRILNLAVTGNIYAASGYSGGIAGYAKGSLENPSQISTCENFVLFTPNNENEYSAPACGGIVGGAHNVIIEDCDNYGIIYSSGDSRFDAGGIVGILGGEASNVRNCFNIQNITGRFAGGIVAHVSFSDEYRSNVLIEKCYNTGNITGEVIAAGLVADLDGAHLAHGYNIGIISSVLGYNAILAPCAGEYIGEFHEDGTVEDLWYLDNFEGSADYGTKCTQDELYNLDMEIEGFVGSCDGYPVLKRERGGHSFQVIEGHVGYQKVRCSNCHYEKINWNDRRLQVISYDENAFAYLSFSDQDGYPWIIDEGGLISSNSSIHKSVAVASIAFMLKKPVIVEFDYKISSEYGYDIFTYSLYQSQFEDESRDCLLQESLSGEKSGTVKKELEVGNYFLNFYYTKDGSISEGNDYARISNISIKSSAKPLTITSQPQSIASAKIGDTVSYRVSAENVSSYQWQYSKDGKEWFNSSAASAKTSTLSLKLSDSNKTNKYRCKLTDQAGKAHYTDSVWVKQVIVDAFKITAQPQSVASAKIGDTITYRVTAQNAASYQWQYSKDGKTWYNSSASSAKTAALSIVLSTSNSANKYRCKITDKQGGVHYTNTVSVQQVISFSITKQPADWDVTKGKAASFSVTATGASSYQWQYSKDRGKTWVKSSITPTLSGGTSTIKVNIAPSNAANVYRCKVTGKDGSVLYTRTAIFKGAPILTGQPKNVTYQAGKTAVFTLTVSNSSICSFQWQYSKDGGKNWYNSGASGTKTTSMSLVMKDTNLGMLYRCKITGSNNVYLYTNSVKLVK